MRIAWSQCYPQISVIREVGGKPVAPGAKPDAGLARGRLDLRGMAVTWDAVLVTKQWLEWPIAGCMANGKLCISRSQNAC